jgi:hypothetical protein
MKIFIIIQEITYDYSKVLLRIKNLVITKKFTKNQ